MTGRASKPETRAFASHTPKWQRFQTSVALSSVKASENTTNVYQRQYAHVYANRLNELKQRCWDNVPDNGSSGVIKCERVLDLQEETPCVVVGTVIKEYGDKDAYKNSKCRPNDTLVLEDESGRVNLQTDRVHEYATGAILAIQGTVKEGGLLHVDAVYTPTPPKKAPALPKKEMKSSSSGQVPHVLLLSGLSCGGPNTPSLQRDMLLAYLQGHLATAASKVCRVIVAGGSTFPENPSFGVKEMDMFLAQCCASGIPVDLLPGKDDPTTANWPQRPIHSSLLKQTDAFGSTFLAKTPNPYAAGLGDKYVLGTDGRNVTDLVQFLMEPTDNKMTDVDEAPTPVTELEALERTLQWGHLCPTGPDSVPTMPHAESDPMIIPHMPDIYFAGNCEQFATKALGKTRLVCIPKFATTGEAVLVNLETLNCELLRFDDSC